MMGKNTLIGWADHTMNFWQGCEKVSRECLHCYIRRTMKRANKNRDPFAGPMRTKDWSKPRKWDEQAAADGVRRRVFTCSLSDFFHRKADKWRDEAWDVVRACQHLDWMILTKRPQLIKKRLPSDWGDDGYQNVWLGATVGVKKSLARLPYLLDVPAQVRFVSVEPLIEPIDFTPYLPQLDWLIVGCESAHRDKRAPMNLDWVRDIRDQCAAFGVPLFFKQYYVGNQIITDGMLDGVVYQEFPTGIASAKR